MGNKLQKLTLVLACMLISFFAFTACADPAPTAAELVEFWPRIDGSTATQPLTNAIYSHFTGIETSADASAIVHHKTYTAYMRLFAEEAWTDENLFDEDPALAEPVDLIFVTAPYDEDLARIGNGYGLVPVVKDALVFLNNQQNPIVNLSCEQLRQIYVGKVTDWAELGGESGQIRAYQRQKASGSQTLFENLLMRELEPTQAPGEWYIGEMGGLIDAVAAYDNADFALGYNMYYYVANMHYDWRVRMLAVDGIEPTNESIASDMYPLNTAYYAVYPKSLPADHPARKLVAWLLTDEGQQVAQAAGYVPLRTLPSSQAIEPPRTVAPESLGIAPQGNRWNELGVTDRLPLMRQAPDDAGAVVLNNIHDNDAKSWWPLVAVLPEAPALEAEINTGIEQIRLELVEKHGIQVEAAEEEEGGSWIEETANLWSNLLTVHFDVYDDYYTIIDQRYAVFDLKSQRRIQLCDLFYEGFDYLRYINNSLATLSLGAPDRYSQFDEYIPPYPYEPTYPFDGVSAQAEFGFDGWDWDYRLNFALESDARFSGVAWYDMYARVNPAVPLWHDISPFGACKVVLQFERPLVSLEKQYMLVPRVISIDDGKRPEVEAAINDEIARATELMRDPAFEPVIDVERKRASKLIRSTVKNATFDEKGSILPEVDQSGRFLTISYYLSVGDIDSTLWGRVYDLHTGKSLFEPEQLRDALASPNAKREIRGKNGSFDWIAITPDDFPEGSGVLRGIEVGESDDGLACLLLLVQPPHGDALTVRVPMADLGLPRLGDFH